MNAAEALVLLESPVDVERDDPVPRAEALLVLLAVDPLGAEERWARHAARRCLTTGQLRQVEHATAIARDLHGRMAAASNVRSVIGAEHVLRTWSLPRAFYRVIQAQYAGLDWYNDLAAVRADLAALRAWLWNHAHEIERVREQAVDQRREACATIAACEAAIKLTGRG